MDISKCRSIAIFSYNEPYMFRHGVMIIGEPMSGKTKVKCQGFKDGKVNNRLDNPLSSRNFRY